MGLATESTEIFEKRFLRVSVFFVCSVVNHLALQNAVHERVGVEGCEVFGFFAETGK